MRRLLLALLLAAITAAPAAARMLGDPSVPFICCAFASGERVAPRRILNESVVTIRIMSLLPEMTGQDKAAIQPRKKRATLDAQHP